MPKTGHLLFLFILLSSLLWCWLLMPVAAEKLMESQSSTKAIAEDRFEHEIKAFEEKDRKQMPPEAGTVFVGSSTFTLWKDLEKRFSKYKAINRGFGGSTLPDINQYLQRIVLKYKPAKVVLYAGTNDIADLGHDGKQVFADFKSFFQTIEKSLPGTEIYFISMSMAPCRTQWKSSYDEGNQLIKEYAQNTEHLHYLDVIPLMRDSNGKLKKELFGLDQLHMNPQGYRLWAPVIEKALSN